MPAVVRILSFAVLTVLLGAVLAPWLFWLGTAVGRAGVLPMLADIGFERYFNRAVMLAAAVMVWPLLRSLDIRTWRGLGLEANPRRWPDLLLGIGIGAGGVAVFAVGAVALEAVTLRKHWTFGDLLGGLLVGAVVTVIEEPFFRGALFGSLRRHMSWPRALVFLSAFFAVLHYTKPARNVVAAADVQWWSGFALLPSALTPSAPPVTLALALAMLFVFGSMLAFSVVATRSLYFALGLHGGFVGVLKAFMNMSRKRREGTIWLDRDLTVGLVPLVLVCLSAMGVVWLLRSRMVSPEKTPRSVS